MFRRLPDSLPEDPAWEADLTRLGYFINEKSEIRQIRHPTERFKFNVTNNEIADRMERLGAPALYLPQMTTEDPKEPCVPIFATRQADLKTKQTVIVIVNDFIQDLGVWAYRTINDQGFDVGSCAGTLKSLKRRAGSTETEPGLVVLNPGQCYYSHREKRALSHASWEALPRKSLFHPAIKVHEAHNLIPGSRDGREHIATAFAKVINNAAYVSENANLFVVGIGQGTTGVLSYLDEHWSAMSSRVKAAAWVHPHVDPQTLNPSLAKFVETRTRAWVVSAAPVNTCVGIADRDDRPTRSADSSRLWEDADEEPKEHFICPTFSGGEENFVECVFPKSCDAMLDFFDDVMTVGEKYVNPAFEPARNSQSGAANARAKVAGLNVTIEELDKTGKST
ncbi:uncharacterized protein PV09_01675 [Verruconis gallopava]|uniref:Arb2 domain-containing protein n=1 Tax=Verruconis gallopava TaxID=253628 RepID=A0A0D2AMM8_9PEZI|nr:uncharacterized protein PV09_01675 [Verruconis gallopava]KIW07745.1 hypothetical protein PV09_01675 [Verruconis gallopava]